MDEKESYIPMLGSAGGRQSTQGMASSHHVLSTVQVETVTLEQLFQEYEISHCRLLKITAPGPSMNL